VPLTPFPLLSIRITYPPGRLFFWSMDASR
jgi:hypothetical protein